MAVALYIHQRGETRIYDGAGTPNYISLPFVQADATFPLNRPRPQPVLRLDRDVFNGFAHFTPGPDASLAEPVQVTFTIWPENQLFDDIIAALSNPFNLAAWSVGASVFTDASGTGASIYNGAGVLFKPPGMGHDPLHKRVHFEWRFDGSPALTRDVVFRHEECYCPPDQIIFGDGDPTTLRVSYWCYGKMTRAAAFTAGTNLTPALI